MSKDLTDVNEFTSPVSVPSGTQTRNDAAGDVERIAQALANRTHSLKLVLDPLNADAALRSVINRFTAAQIINVLTEADVPLLSTESTPDDYAPNAANRWKLELAFGQKSGSASYAALFVGQPPDGLALISNARWHLQTQKWRQLDATKPSAALVLRGGQCIASTAPAGTAPWSDWPTTGAPGGGDVVAGGEFSFVPGRTRTSLVNLGLASIPGGPNGGPPVTGWFRNNTTGYWECGNSSAQIIVPIQLPRGAVLTKIEVRHGVLEGQSPDIKFLQRAPKWGVGENTPDIDSQPFGASDAIWPNLGNATWTGTATINNQTTEYEVRMFNAFNLAAVRLTWTDSGPRNG